MFALEPHEVVLAALVLCMGVVLAGRTSRRARPLVFISALIVSALLFLPGEQITGAIGKDSVAMLRDFAGRTPWKLSDWTHFVIFVWLGLLVWLCRPDLRGWLAWGLVVVLAVAAELAQGLAPSREPRLDDVLLNLAGGMIGLVLGILFGGRARRVHRGDGEASP